MHRQAVIGLVGSNWYKFFCVAFFFVLISALTPKLANAQANKLAAIATGDGYPPYVDWRSPSGGIATDVVRLSCFAWDTNQNLLHCLGPAVTS
jgi:hypothetical protein